MEHLDYRHLIGGLGIFLFGMLVFEETIAELGKGFLKKFLEKNTNTRFKSIVTGVIQTCIFQSSHVVNMMTLGFVGAGVIGLSNAVGVVLGANLGTTLTPWLITIFGFEINIESIALPIIGLGGIATVIFSKNEKIVQIAKFFIGFGLLFLGLGYMKESVDLIAANVSLDAYANFNIWGYVLIGTLITTVMQTSTGSTIIVLTALNSGLISLDMALPLVIGANMGSSVSTTIIGLLSSKPTQVAKKKLVLSNFTFNITITILITLCYPYIKDFLLRFGKLTHLESNILLLSLFHTFFNLTLVVIWAPLVSPLLKFLNKLIPPKKLDLDLAIDKVSTTLPEEMIAALEHDVQYMMAKVEAYNRKVLYVDNQKVYPQDIQKDYITIKEIESRLVPYIVKVHKTLLNDEQSHRMQTLYEAIMHSITSSKEIKDVQHHIINLKDESISNEIVADSLHFLQTLIIKTSDTIDEIGRGDTQSNIQYLETIIQSIHASDDEFLETLTDKVTDTDTDSSYITEVIKTNRYVLLSCEELLKAHIAYMQEEITETISSLQETTNT